MSEISFKERQSRAVSALHEAILSIQRAQNYLGIAKQFKTLNGVERKIIDSIHIDLFEPIDRINAVREAQRIGLK